jgi:hypothetical protein
MKIFKMMLMVWALASTGVMAQDYYAPTDKEKEPVARFPFDVKPEIKTENGEKVLKYTLPTMLTGNVNVIRTTAVDLPGLSDLPNPVKMFVGDKATVTCMGTDSNPGCMVTHRNLSLNKDLAFQEIDRTYYDPELRLAARKVVDEFQRAPVEHSGNQPIGIIGALKDRQDAGLPQGVMRTQFVRDGSLAVAQITWDTELVNNKPRLKKELKFTVANSSITGSLNGVEQFGNRVRGRWSAAGESGWFDFEFNNAKTRFEGTYGLNENGSARAGTWNSAP